MSSSRPNVLWIFSDQHSAHAVSSAGDPNIETPSLDRLAAEGVRFTNAYSTCPLCAPFRATLYTGQYIHQHGVISLFRPLLPSVGPQLPEVLREGGYHTSHMGKWHLAGGDCPCPYVSPYFRPGWDDWTGWENSNDFLNTVYCTGDHPHPIHTLPGYQTDGLTDLTLEWLRQRDGGPQPWFHVMSVEPPHNGMPERYPESKYFAPEPYMAMFRDKALAFRPNFATDHPRSAQFEHDLRGYYAAIANLDDNVGRILDVLEETGQLENTMIWYFADHGDMMGSHGRQQKSRPEQESANIPLIVRYPKGLPSGHVSDALIGAVDFMPTLLGFLGLAIPSSVQGDDLSATMTGATTDGAESVLIQYDRPFFPPAPSSSFRALRADRWLYSVSPVRGPDLLFDLVSDPFQLSNLIASPEHAEIRSDLHARLLTRLAEVGDECLLE